MDDLIRRQAVIDVVRRCSVKEVAPAYMLIDKAEVMTELMMLPSAQPEPDIIACGDCKHWICHDKRCGYWNHGVKPLDWCCHGERRTDE